MKKIYLSIPITGVEENIIERFNEAVKTIKSILNQQDYELIYPVGFNIDADNVKDFFGGEKYKDKPYSWFMGKDVERLLECDAVFFANGWKNSKGCQAEKKIAEIYDIQHLS